MAALQSELFRGDPRLQRCLVSDPAHVLRGDRGDFVSKIQYAVLVLAGGKISGTEIDGQLYGPDTAKAVLEYKRQRRIINFSYQTQADDIVGKMTIRALDTEIAAMEQLDRLRGNDQRIA